MRKILALFAIVATFCSCSKDDEKDEAKEQTFFVNVYEQYTETSSKKFAESCAVFLFKDNGKAIDYKKSPSSVRYDYKLTYTDGSISEKYNYVSPSTTGVNTFKSIPNGKYILWISCSPYAILIKSSSKMITVDSKLNMKTEELIFKGTDFGYQEWNKPW